MAKKILILIIGIILIGGSVVAFVYFQNKNATSGKLLDTSFKDFLPFGIGSPSNEQGTNTGTNSEENNDGTPSNENTTNNEIDRLVQIVNYKVAGATAIIGERKSNTTDGNENVGAIRFVEQANGNVREMYLDTKEIKAIPSSIIPSIYESIFDGGAGNIVHRYLSNNGEDIESFLSGVGSQNGQYLPKNIVTIVNDPLSTAYFYITKSSDGSAIGTLFKPSGSKMTKIFNSAVSEWISEWPGATYVYLTTKPSWDTKGYVYSLNTTNGIYTKVLGGIKGLTTKVNQDGSRMIYSKTTEQGPHLSMYKTKIKTTTDLNINSYAEKCVFAFNTVDIYCAVPNISPARQNPDLWYQGLESYEDSIYKINTNTGSISLLINTNIKDGIDATNLFLDKANENLFFINKKDSTLWSLSL